MIKKSTRNALLAIHLFQNPQSDSFPDRPRPRRGPDRRPRGAGERRS